MNYEQKYKEAIESIKRIYDQADSYGRELMEKEFPELRESEDELMRKEAIAIIKQYNIICEREGDKCYTADRVISWLEKQGEQNKQHLYDIIIALWNLLDKIDTFSDLQIDDTNPDNPFRKIEDITQERHKFVKSDGYNLFIENFMITNDKNFEKQGEQNSTPKFKIGDTIHKIGENTVFPRTIEKIEDGDYVCNNSHSFVNIKKL